MSKKAQILYEPMPIGRIGLRKKDESVVIAKDFSTFAFMLEEYISYGAINIILPQSSPEINALEEMPSLLRKRIKVVNDSNELEIVNRLLFNLRKEFEVEINNNNGFLRFKKETSHHINKYISLIHYETRKLAIGFNHNVQVNINTKVFIAALMFLRGEVKDTTTRVVLAQLEAIIKQYSDFNIDAITPPKNSSPIELINIFDRLINDPLYVSYSSSVANLNTYNNKNHLLVELRNRFREIASKNYLETGWDYITKIVKLFTAIPIPDSKILSTLINNKNFPVLVNMESAKKRAFENWRKSYGQCAPLSRAGFMLANEEVDWIPVSDSVDVSGQDGTFLSIGKVKDVLKILNDFTPSTNQQEF